MRKIRNETLKTAGAKQKAKTLGSQVEESSSGESSEKSSSEDESPRRVRVASVFPSNPKQATSSRTKPGRENNKSIRFSELMWTGRTTRSALKQPGASSKTTICPDDVETEAIGDSDNSEIASPRPTRALKHVKPNAQHQQLSQKKLRPSTRQAESETGIQNVATR